MSYIQDGVLTKEQTSDWGSPLVVIPKADERVHQCIDYKVGVNEQLHNAHYPTRKIDDILNSIKTAPSDFNRIIDQILRYVPKTMSYFDDIIVHVSTREECQHNLRAYLDQLQKFDLHLNQQKCSLFQGQIEYLGQVIEFNKISKSPGKVAAIFDMPRPKSTKDAPPSQHCSAIFCVRTLFSKWTSACEAEFLKLKQAIASDQVLVPYDPDLPVQLVCDASPTGIAGVLSYIVDGHEHPITFASRSLTAAEQNYSHFGREATGHCLYKCLAIKNSPDKAPSHTWVEPEHNWQRIHIDYASPYQDHHFLLVVEAKSKWAEIVLSSSVPKSKSSIEILKDIFSRNGFPEVMVSNMATIFTSKEFAQFCKEAGIFQKFCEAGHQATNGLAECNVRTLKHRLETMSNQNMSIHQKVREILFRYWATPLSNGKSPNPNGCTSANSNHQGVPLPARKTVYFDLQPKSPMSDDRQLNKPNLGDLIEIMDPDVVLSEAEQPDPIEQEGEVPVVDFQPPVQPAQRERPQRERRLSVY
ncbi:hypothetical protein PR048_020883 [Dryococelus australis]|uniref:Integrase catalytic domain-containing protein n=1 Tax=Dryococelus australis TaxID=614101 RepID=A0ABQ9GWM8_9NEOP|nr:hypothetical protein PR048_020883 [Dryococelus australis]